MAGYITPLDLYAFAKDHNLLDARIRITDAEAVSFYPDSAACITGVYEVILDVSGCQPIAFDELDIYAKRAHGVHDLELANMGF